MDSPHYGSTARGLAAERFCHAWSFLLTTRRHASCLAIRQPFSTRTYWLAKSLVMDGPRLVLLPGNRCSSRAVRRTMCASLPCKPSKLYAFSWVTLKNTCVSPCQRDPNPMPPFEALLRWDTSKNGFFRAREASTTGSLPGVWLVSWGGANQFGRRIGSLKRFCDEESKPSFWIVGNWQTGQKRAVAIKPRIVGIRTMRLVALGNLEVAPDATSLASC
jgi:hypothetical protein